MQLVKGIDSLHVKKILKMAMVVCVYATYIGAIFYLLYQTNLLTKKSSEIEENVAYLKDIQEDYSGALLEELYNDQLMLQSNRADIGEIERLKEELERFKNENETLLTVDEIYALYSSFNTKVKRNLSVKLEIDPLDDTLTEWGNLLLAQDFETLKSAIQKYNAVLDAAHAEYIASLPKPSAPAEGYSYLNVSTEKGTFGTWLIKVPINSVKVKTLAAIESDCKNDCPTKTLQQYVEENGGFAGINGSYNCPPDYSACQDKKNSFDFALYDSNDGRWFNKGALGWSDTGLVTFSNGKADFYKKSTDYDGDSVNAAISNYPSLLKDSKVVVDEGKLTSFQKVRGLRGALGLGGENIYLVHISNATVVEAAYVMKALGAIHALNLDGGGSAAMYINGRYVLGPGRGLSNAIVLIR